MNCPSNAFIESLGDDAHAEVSRYFADLNTENVSVSVTQALRVLCMPLHFALTVYVHVNMNWSCHILYVLFRQERKNWDVTWEYRSRTSAENLGEVKQLVVDYINSKFL